MTVVVARDMPTANARDTEAIAVVRHVLANAITSRQAEAQGQDLIVFLPLIQKAYLALEAAEVAFGSWNLVAIAVSCRALLESAAISCAVVDDPATAKRLIDNPTMPGTTFLQRLSTGDPAISRETIDYVMSIAHPSSRGYQLLLSGCDFQTNTSTSLLGRWNAEVVELLQRACVNAGFRIWQNAVRFFGVTDYEDDFAARIDRARKEASRPENLDIQVSDAIELVGEFALRQLSRSQQFNLATLRGSEAARLRLFATQYVVHCSLATARYLQFANPDGFIAVLRSWIEACALARISSGPSNDVQRFLRKSRTHWKDSIAALRTELPDVLQWYGQASPYPHASFNSLSPRLLVNKKNRTVNAVLMPVWDDRIHVWLDRVKALVEVSDQV